MYKVLFVCTGNLCRSAMAEGILRDLVARQGRVTGEEGARSAVGVSSAGTCAAEGLQASPEAIEVCSQHGVDMAAHRSRALSAELLAEADLVLTMEPHHRRAAIELAPRRAHRVHLLSEFAGDWAAGGVADPFGAEVAEYRRTFGMLTALLQKALPGILQRAAQEE